MDFWVVSTYQLWCIMPLWTWVYNYLFESLPSILWDIYLEVKLLDPLVIPCLTFWGTTKPFFTVATPFYIPTRNAQGFQFLLRTQARDTCYFLFCYFITLAILMSVKQYLNVVGLCCCCCFVFNIFKLQKLRKGSMKSGWGAGSCWLETRRAGEVLGSGARVWGYFLWVSPSLSCPTQRSLKSFWGTWWHSVKLKQEGRGQGTTFKRMT